MEPYRPPRSPRDPRQNRGPASGSSYSSNASQQPSVPAAAAHPAGAYYPRGQSLDEPQHRGPLRTAPHGSSNDPRDFSTSYGQDSASERSGGTGRSGRSTTRLTGPGPSSGYSDPQPQRPLQTYGQNAYPPAQQFGIDEYPGPSAAPAHSDNAHVVNMPVAQQPSFPLAESQSMSASTLAFPEDNIGGYPNGRGAGYAPYPAHPEPDNISAYYAQDPALANPPPRPSFQGSRPPRPQMMQPQQFQQSYDLSQPNFGPQYGTRPMPQGAYPPPQMMRRRGAGTIFRHKTKKTINLTPQGNFVVEIPVPAKVREQSKSNDREFTHLRYSAVVGDPNDFVKRGYTLRAKDLGRHTELMVVMTMYNEDEILFAKTWKAVMKNIAHLCSKKKHPMWGVNGWEKVVVCVVSDGRTKINPRTLNVLGVMGLFQDGVIKTSINNQDVAAHVFEFTTQVCVDPDLNVRGSQAGVIPVQTIFCLKEKNAKKLNSHRWFFSAFGATLNPNVCILLDVGTKPTEASLHRLWKAFDADPQVAGACGEIAAETGDYGQKLWNPLVAAQNFEYKMSNILDKPLESVFGFIAVLPGAFSAYRYKALQNGADGTGPLQKYFLGESLHGSHGDVNLSQANMYLAEDRILCYELVTKKNENWVLRYVKSAKAETDVPDTLPEFVSQRRRWLNGSFFAGIHAIAHWYQIFRSGHSIIRMFAILTLLVYNSINVIFNWFSLATFYLIFYFLGNGMVADPKTDPFYGAGDIVMLVVRQVYIFSIVAVFIASLGNRPQGSRLLYTAVFGLFALIMILMLYMAGFSLYLSVTAAIAETAGDAKKLPKLIEKAAFRDLLLSTLTTYGAYIIASVAYFDPWHMVNSFAQYLLFLPGFINILMVYAFTNLHDISWGTKGDNATADQAPVVVKKDDKSGTQVATVDLPVEQKDIDASYDAFLRALPSPPKQGKSGSGRSAALKQEDYFRLFRTRVVLFWILCNVALVAVLTTDKIANKIGIFSGPEGVGQSNSFLTFMLWSVAALATFRFGGSMMYLCTQASVRKR